MKHITASNFVPITSKQKISHYHFEGISFVDLKVEGVVFEDCTFSECNFASAEFMVLQVYNCQFSHCRFSHANFNEALFDTCNFYDVKKDQGSDFSYAQFKFAKFLQCDLSQCTFKYTDLFGVSIKGCKVLAGDFEYANFANKVSPKITFAEAEITDSILRFCRFVRVYLANCNLSGNDFTEADFSHSHLAEANLMRCLLDGASFVQSSLEGAELQESSIVNLDLTGCSLKKLKISADQCIEFLRLFEIEVV